jgi:thymidylate synthase (FAD)
MPLQLLRLVGTIKKEGKEMNHSVKLIAKTIPECNTDLNSITDLLAYMARVSNPANQDNKTTAEKLLKYLVKNKHWSPFEMVHIVLEIQCSRSIGRQILRHRSFSFQEFSQRYAEVDESMFQKVEARIQDKKNRQNSISEVDELVASDWDIIQSDIIFDAIENYQYAIKIGIAKEQARAILPEGLTMSRMYMSGSLRSWIHYCQLRMGNGTQKEHREIAEDCWKIIYDQVPALNEILENQSVS